jgi:hypothetical protein
MTEVGLETLQNWRLTEAEIDGFCHFWYDGILRLHILADDVGILC